MRNDDDYVITDVFRPEMAAQRREAERAGGVSSLFDTPQPEPKAVKARARLTDPDTSRAAARSVNQITTKQNAVLVVLAEFGPLTDVDLIHHYAQTTYADTNPQSDSGLRTRRSELVERGLVNDSGHKAVLESGRSAILWETNTPTTESD